MFCRVQCRISTDGAGGKTATGKVDVAVLELEVGDLVFVKGVTKDEED